MLISDKRMYGNGTVDFKKTVDSWLIKVNNEKTGQFKLNSKLYNDSGMVVNLFSDDDYKKMLKSILIVIKNKNVKPANFVEKLGNLRDIEKNEVLNFLKTHVPNLSILLPIKDKIGNKEAKKLLDYWISNNVDLEKMFLYNVNTILTYFKEYIEKVPKKIIFEYLKNVKKGAKFDSAEPNVDIMNEEYIQHLFNLQELCEIFKNEYPQLKLAYYMGKKIISFNDIIQHIGLDNLASTPVLDAKYRVFQKLFDENELFNENKSKIAELIKNEYITSQKSRSRVVVLNVKGLNDNIIRINDNMLKQLYKLGLKEHVDEDITVLVKKLFIKYEWKEKIEPKLLESINLNPGNKKVTMEIIEDINDLYDCKNGSEIEEYMHHQMHGGRHGGFGGKHGKHGMHGYGGFGGGYGMHGGFGSRHLFGFFGGYGVTGRSGYPFGETLELVRYLKIDRDLKEDIYNMIERIIHIIMEELFHGWY